MKNDDSYNTPKDFFIYLLSIITLYLFFTSVLILLFKYINIIFPTVISRYSDYNLDSIRWQIAILIITFPVYLYTLISIRKDYLRYPEKRNLKVRKWLLYFTLFLAAIIIMSDLGALLYYFLGGDITLRFLMKTMVIFFLISTLFWFYLRELHRGWNATKIKLWLGSVLFLVIGTLLYGFYVIGSPATARKELIDKQRVNDLMIIQNQLISYWIQKKQLPSSLNVLNNNITGFRVPVDPQSNTAYSYRAISPFTFELCATFSKPSSENQKFLPQQQTQNWNWIHPAGLYCFQRTIDPAQYHRN